MSRRSLLEAGLREAAAGIPRGAAAGVLGTLAMTAWQELAARLRGGGSSESDGSSQPHDPWEEAPVPAQVARRAAAMIGWDVSPEHIPLLTNVMHWGYGTSWGAAYGVLARWTPRGRPLPVGAIFGASVWVMSYVQLVPMGLYEPPWRYPAADSALDLSYHLVYGVGTASGFALINRLPG